MTALRRLVPAALGAVALATAGCGGGGASAEGPGADEYRQFACASCHSLDGSDGTGPTFQGIAGAPVTLADGSQVPRDAAYLARAITDPDAQVVKGYNPGLMTAAIAGFDLESKPEDVRRLVQFIQSVK